MSPQEGESFLGWIFSEKPKSDEIVWKGRALRDWGNVTPSIKPEVPKWKSCHTFQGLIFKDQILSGGTLVLLAAATALRTASFAGAVASASGAFLLCMPCKCFR